MTKIPELFSRASTIEGDGAYRLAGIEQMLTPFLGIFLEMVDSNIAVTIKSAGGESESSAASHQDDEAAQRRAALCRSRNSTV